MWTEHWSNLMEPVDFTQNACGPHRKPGAVWKHWTGNLLRYSLTCSKNLSLSEFHSCAGHWGLQEKITVDLMQPFISLSKWAKIFFLIFFSPGRNLLETVWNKFNVNNSLSVRKQHWSYVIMGRVNWVKAAYLNKQWRGEKTGTQ